MIDTGIKVDHEEFEGRAEWLMNFTDDGHDGDGAGHGTWTSGLVASRTYGVAKKAKVFALKVFRDDGTADGAGIIAAMDYVVQDMPTRDCPAGHLVNMSLGGGFSQASNDAADAMVNAGAFVAVAAGNDNVDAKDTSPASASLVCTVGATDQTDAKASFSSFGEVVDIWAPGVDLESTSYEGGSVSLTIFKPLLLANTVHRRRHLVPLAPVLSSLVWVPTSPPSRATLGLKLYASALKIFPSRTS